MMILALETATLVSSVALASEERLLAELTTAARLTHSETLLPHIQKVLEMAGVERSELGAVAVSIGPGSFTGLRIGLATAKGVVTDNRIFAGSRQAVRAAAVEHALALLYDEVVVSSL